MSSNGLIPSDVALPPGRLLLAFSGGDDSLALLSVLSEIAPGRTGAMYVNHAIREERELAEEEELNRHNAALLGIPLHIERLGRGRVDELSRLKGIGTEAAARTLRYEALRRYAAENGFDRILTAHHRDDQAETVAMRMLSSAPFYAWSAIVRDDGMLYRPLLPYWKSEILDYLSSTGLAPSIDTTNEDTAYSRNRIRKALMPSLSLEAKDMMASIADNVAAFRDKHRLEPSFSGFYIAYSREDIIKAPRFASERAVYDANASLGSSMRISRHAIDAVLSKAEEGRGSMAVGDLEFIFTKDEMRIYPSLPDFAMPLEDGAPIADGLRLSIGGACDGLTLRMPLSSLSHPAVIRSARECDVIALKGADKKVSELMKDQRVPYAAVIEDRSGIAAYLARPFGGRDRLSRRFLGASGEPVALALI